MLVSMAACLMGWATAAPSAGCGKDPLYPPGKVAQHTIHVTDPSEPNGLTRKVSDTHVCLPNWGLQCGVRPFVDGVGHITVEGVSGCGCASKRCRA